MTTNGLRVVLIDFLAESGLHDLVYQLGIQLSLSRNINCLPNEHQTRFLSNMDFTIPETYQLPKGSPKTIWNHWCLPNYENSIPNFVFCDALISLNKSCEKDCLT